MRTKGGKVGIRISQLREFRSLSLVKIKGRIKLKVHRSMKKKERNKVTSHENKREQRLPVSGTRLTDLFVRTGSKIHREAETDAEHHDNEHDELCHLRDRRAREAALPGKNQPGRNADAIWLFACFTPSLLSNKERRNEKTRESFEHFQGFLVGAPSRKNKKDAKHSILSRLKSNSPQRLIILLLGTLQVVRLKAAGVNTSRVCANREF